MRTQKSDQPPTRERYLIYLVATCRQLEAWLMIDPNFKGWPAAQSYLEQLQRDLEPFLCPTCKDILPDSGPCWGCQFPEEKEETVTREELEQALIPGEL